jgi:hypothetical protein
MIFIKKLIKSNKKISIKSKNTLEKIFKGEVQFIERKFENNIQDVINIISFFDFGLKTICWSNK